MKCLIWLIGFICAIAQQSVGTKPSTRKTVCYYDSSAATRLGNGQFRVNRIQPQLCTHLVYGFAGIDANQNVISLNPTIDFAANIGYLAFTDLVTQNTNLIPMLSIGGSSATATRFQQLVTSIDSRKRFVDSVVVFLRKYNFKGLDIFWEEIPSIHRSHFVLLLKELRTEFRKLHCTLYLSVTLSVETNLVISSYDLTGISRNVDHINLRTFGYPQIAGRTGHHAQFNAVESTINFLVSRGAARRLLVVGIAAYGNSFTLSNILTNGVGAPVSSPGFPGPFLRRRGILGYNEICQLNLTERYEPAWRSPYGVKGNQWVGFDNRNSTIQKCGLARRYRLAGGMLWSIDSDDYLGTCQAGVFPLLRTVKGKC
ncbi:Chitinase 2 [Chamberlinius hualienensis]